MPRPRIKEPPFVKDPVLYQWLLDLCQDVYGVGDDTTGRLDGDNISGVIPVTTAPTTITGVWTFLKQVFFEQPDAAGGVPVITIRQADISEEFIKFIGSAISGNVSQSLVKIADANTTTLTGLFKITIQDNGNQIAAGDYYVPFFRLT